MTDRATFERHFQLTLREQGQHKNGEYQYPHIQAKWEGWQAREQLSVPVPNEQGDSICAEDDGCPTERAVLQRFWREHQAAAPAQGDVETLALAQEAVDAVCRREEEGVDIKKWARELVASTEPAQGERQPEDWMEITPQYDWRGKQR